MSEINKSEAIKPAPHYKMDPAQRAKQFAPFDALKGFKEEIHEKEKDNIEFNGQLPVSVIASFNPDGEMIPIYFGFEGNRLRVDHIVWNASGKWGCKYRCEITDEDMVKSVDLIYYNLNEQWKIKY